MRELLEDCPNCPNGRLIPVTRCKDDGWVSCTACYAIFEPPEELEN